MVNQKQDKSVLSLIIHHIYIKTFFFCTLIGLNETYSSKLPWRLVLIPDKYTNNLVMKNGEIPPDYCVTLRYIIINSL